MEEVLDMLYDLSRAIHSLLNGCGGPLENGRFWPMENFSIRKKKHMLSMNRTKLNKKILGVQHSISLVVDKEDSVRYT